MKCPRVLLLGYYGKGNFGDDVLLVVSNALVRQAMPDAQIAVVADAQRGAYVQAMLPQAIVLPPGRHGEFDAIVHGGGGVFFDFKRYGIVARLAEFLLRIIGWKQSVRLEKTVRHLVGKPRSHTKRRVGIGIGVGTFTPGSKRLRAAMPILHDFSVLWVRDCESVHNLARFASVAPQKVIVGSDLAFFTEHWLTALPHRKEVTARSRLGVILRDWPIEQGGIPDAQLRDAIAVLARRYDVTVLIFDPRVDLLLQRTLAEYVPVIWKPETMRIDDFVQHLAQQDVLLTSRAHGAICGACLGIPSVIVAIEPKLRTIAAMLPNASLLVEAQQPEHWADAIEKALAISPDAIAADVTHNRMQSQAAWDCVSELLV